MSTTEQPLRSYILEQVRQFYTEELSPRPFVSGETPVEMIQYVLDVFEAWMKRI